MVVMSFFQEYQYDIPTLLSIATFMKRNNVYGKDIASILKTAMMLLT